MYEDQLKEVAVLSIKFMKDYMAGSLPEDAVDKTKLNHATANIGHYQRFIATKTGQKHVDFIIAAAIAEDKSHLKKYIELTNPQMKPLLLNKPERKNKARTEK